MKKLMSLILTAVLLLTMISYTFWDDIFAD